MAITATPLKAMRIGCDHVVWCRMAYDNASGVSYETIYQLPGLMTLNINPNASIETAYYDDGPGEVATTLGNVEVTFNKSALGLKEQAVILGSSYVKQALDATATPEEIYELVSGATDTPPWGALGFRTLKSDGTYRYVWLLKGKFSIPENNNETKADTINFQSDEITGRFVVTLYGYELTNTAIWSAEYSTKTIYPWKAEWDETSVSDQTIRAKIKSDWFTQVITPNYLPS